MLPGQQPLPAGGWEHQIYLPVNRPIQPASLATGMVAQTVGNQFELIPNNEIPLPEMNAAMNHAPQIIVYIMHQQELTSSDSGAVAGSPKNSNDLYPENKQDDLPETQKEPVQKAEPEDSQSQPDDDKKIETSIDQDSNGSNSPESTPSESIPVASDQEGSVSTATSESPLSPSLDNENSDNHIEATEGTSGEQVQPQSSGENTKSAKVAATTGNKDVDRSNDHESNGHDYIQEENVLNSTPEEREENFKSPSKSVDEATAASGVGAAVKSVILTEKASDKKKITVANSASEKPSERGQDSSGQQIDAVTKSKNKQHTASPGDANGSRVMIRAKSKRKKENPEEQHDVTEGKAKKTEKDKAKQKKRPTEKVIKPSRLNKAKALVLIGAKKLCGSPKKNRFYLFTQKKVKKTGDWIAGAFKKFSATSRKIPKPGKALARTSVSSSHRPSALKSVSRVIVLGGIATLAVLYGTYGLYRRLVSNNSELDDSVGCQAGTFSAGFFSACEQLKETYPTGAQWVVQAAKTLNYFPVFMVFTPYSEPLPVSSATEKNKRGVFAAKGFYNLKKGTKTSQPSIELNDKILSNYLMKTTQKIMKSLSSEQLQQDGLSPLSQVLLWCGVSNSRIKSHYAAAERCTEWVVKQIKDNPDQPWYQKGIHSVYFQQFSEYSAYLDDEHYLGVMPVYHLEVQGLKQFMKYEPRVLFIALETLPSVNIPLSALAGASLYSPSAEKAPWSAEIYRLGYGNTWIKEHTSANDGNYVTLPQGEIFSFSRNGTNDETKYFTVVGDDFLFSLDMNKTDAPENNVLKERHWALHPYKRDERTAYSTFPLYQGNKWNLEPYANYKEMVSGIPWIDALLFLGVVFFEYHAVGIDATTRGIFKGIIRSAGFFGFYRLLIEQISWLENKWNWLGDYLNYWLSHYSRWGAVNDLIQDYGIEGEQNKINLLIALALDVVPVGVMTFSYNSNGYMLASEFLPMENFPYKEQKKMINEAYRECHNEFGSCDFMIHEHLEFFRFNLMLCSYLGFKGCHGVWKDEWAKNLWFSYLCYIDWKNEAMRLDQEVDENQFKINFQLKLYDTEIINIRYVMQSKAANTDLLKLKYELAVKGEFKCNFGDFNLDKSKNTKNKCITREGITYITFYGNGGVRLGSPSTTGNINPEHVLALYNGHLITPYWKRQAAWQESHVIALTESDEAENENGSFAQQSAAETVFRKDWVDSGTEDYPVKQVTDNHTSQADSDFCNSMTFDQVRQLCLGESQSADDKKYFKWIDEYGISVGRVNEYDLINIDYQGSKKKIAVFSGGYEFSHLSTDRLKIHLEQLRGMNKLATQRLSDVFLSHVGYIKRNSDEVDALVYDQVYSMLRAEYKSEERPVSRQLIDCNLDSFFRRSICGDLTRCIKALPAFNMTDKEMRFYFYPVRKNLDGREESVKFNPDPGFAPCIKFKSFTNEALKFSALLELSLQESKGAIKIGEHGNEYHICFSDIPFLVKGWPSHTYMGIIMLSNNELFFGGCDTPELQQVSPDVLQGQLGY